MLAIYFMFDMVVIDWNQANEDILNSDMQSTVVFLQDALFYIAYVISVYV